MIILELNSMRESSKGSGSISDGAWCRLGHNKHETKSVFVIPFHETLIISEAKSNFPFLEWNHLGRIPNQKKTSVLRQWPAIQFEHEQRPRNAAKICSHFKSSSWTSKQKGETRTKHSLRPRTCVTQERDKIGENVLFLTQFFIQQNGHCWEFCLPCWPIRSFRLVNLK